MKKCRSLKGILSAITHNEDACLEYVSDECAFQSKSHVIVLRCGKVLRVMEQTYNAIKPYMVKVSI